MRFYEFESKRLFGLRGVPLPTGSRVVVMSARPGRIKADIAVELPHPRPYTIKTTPEFVALKERLVEEIRVEAVLAAEAH